MKKNLKIIGICIISIVVCFAIYIRIEVYRFNNYLGCRPLIRVEPINVEVTANSNTKKEKYNGLGYTIEYEYLVEKNENSDVQLITILEGEMRLFDKFLLSAWIQ